MLNIPEPVSPFFSVIIPAYNRSHLIKPTIESVLAQSFQDFEVIVVDDCSQDVKALEAALDAFNDQRIQLIKHDINKNGAATRNTGIKNAKGKYVAFLDSDDTWPYDRLDEVYQEIVTVVNAENMVFYGQVDFKFPEQKQGEIRPKVAIGDMPVSDYLFIHGGLIQTSTIVCANEVAKAIMFDERYKRHQDYDFCLRAQVLGFEFHFIEKVLSHWLRHKGANVIAKGANVDFCLFWLAQMQKYFSSKALSAYKIKVLMPIAFESGRWLLALKLLLTQSFRVPFKIFRNGGYASIKGIVKFFLARVK